MSKGAIVNNSTARRDYDIIETYEAGIELKGSEAKSLREHRADLKGSFAKIKEDQIYIHNFHINPYEKAGNFAPPAERERRLLLHKKEIQRLIGKTSERGFTLIPLSAYFKRGFVKVEVALCKGKRRYDKRQALKRKAHETEIKRALRHKN